ncbi:glycosyltransferase [Nitrospinota bacterium]
MTKLIYAGPNCPGSTCLARFRAFQEIEAEVFPLNTAPYFYERISRWRRALEFRVFFGPQGVQLNRELIHLCDEKSPDVVWVDKGFWTWPSTLKTIRKKGILLVHHCTDAMTPHTWNLWWDYSMLRKTEMLYDLRFTSNLPDHARLAGNLRPRSELTYLGYDHERFDDSPLSPDLQEKWASEILFVGHYEERTERGISALIEAGLPVTVYGDGWEKARSRELLNSRMKIRRLNDEEYRYALKSAKIALCFVSEINSNQTAGRSFEIPACGTFLLAMRTGQHAECYREGEEAEFFGNHRELVEKARFYLEHADRREEISRRGHERCLRSGYSWADHTKRDWEKVEEMLAEHRSRGENIKRASV